MKDKERENAEVELASDKESYEFNRTRYQSRRVDQAQLGLRFEDTVKTLDSETESLLRELRKPQELSKETRNVIAVVATVLAVGWLLRLNSGTSSEPRPPFNAEYVLHFLLQKEERDIVIGDLIEEYGKLLARFDRRRADIWFYKQVGGSLLPLLRRALLRIGALVWLGRILRRLVS